ncbi:prophage tail fiber N-terminal domain-containing protein, partial [Yersinia enterocolitica]
SGYQIILKARVNTAELVMRTIATITMEGNGEYSFDAQVGRYCVYLRHGWSNEYCVGDITVLNSNKDNLL